LLFSQVVTLYITPVYYVYLDRLQRKMAGWKKKRKSDLVPTREPVDAETLMGHHD
jgi:hypothetical protein